MLCPNTSRNVGRRTWEAKRLESFTSERDSLCFQVSCDNILLGLIRRKGIITKVATDPFPDGVTCDVAEFEIKLFSPSALHTLIVSSLFVLQMAREIRLSFNFDLTLFTDILDINESLLGGFLHHSFRAQSRCRSLCHSKLVRGFWP